MNTTFPSCAWFFFYHLTASLFPYLLASFFPIENSSRAKGYMYSVHKKCEQLRGLLQTGGMDPKLHKDYK
jgi:hypothetical protein